MKLTKEQEKKVALQRSILAGLLSELAGLKKELPLLEARLEWMRVRIAMLPEEIEKAGDRKSAMQDRYEKQNEAADRLQKIKALQRQIAKLESHK